MLPQRKEDKSLYRTLCEEESYYNIPIFSRAWYLDCTCGKDGWDVLLYRENGKVLASWAFCLHKNRISMPPLTQTMGIVFYEQNFSCSAEKVFYKKRELTEALLSEIPETKYFLQNFDSSFTDWLPFYWKDYRQTTRYTYRITDLTNLPEIYEKSRDFIRKNCKKAQQRFGLSFEELTDVEEYYRVLHKTFERQGIKYEEKDLVKRLYRAACSRGQGKLFAVRELDGQIHAVGFLVWQKSCAYYISGGADPELRSSGAQAFLLWNMIKFASAVAESFDFEGSMIKGVEFFFNAYASEQTPYFSIYKDERIIAPALQAGMDVLRKVKHKICKVVGLW